jgi:hypothetical protein
VSFENKLYTWGAARHGRLGDVEDWDELHVDPLDEAGRYRALPEEVESVDEMKPFKVACTNTSTFVLGSVMPPQWQQFVDRATSRFGWLSSAVSRASRSPSSSRPTSAGSSRAQSRAGSRPGSAGSRGSNQSPRHGPSPRPKRGTCHNKMFCVLPNDRFLAFTFRRIDLRSLVQELRTEATRRCQVRAILKRTDRNEHANHTIPLFACGREYGPAQ